MMSPFEAEYVNICTYTYIISNNIIHYISEIHLLHYMCDKQFFKSYKSSDFPIHRTVTLVRYFNTSLQHLKADIKLH